MYHGSGVIGSNIWCSAWDNSLVPADTTGKDVEAGVGFSGYVKCTWYLTAANGDCGLGFTIKKSTGVDPAGYHVKYVEWTDDAAM